MAEALDAGVGIDGVYAEPGADEALLRRCTEAGLEVVPVAEGALRKVLDLVSPQAIVAVVRQAPATLAAVLADSLERRCPVIVLVGLQDPGNAGTLIRVAEASGCAGVVLTEGCVDVWNPKVVRASAGSVLRVPVVEGAEVPGLLEVVRSAGLSTAGTVVADGLPPESQDLAGAVAVLVGSEAHGLSDDVQSALDVRLMIPMEGEVESLNAAVAGSLVAFEAARQRRVGGGDQAIN